MRPNGIYVATDDIAGVFGEGLFEFDIPTNVTIEILRVRWSGTENGSLDGTGLNVYFYTTATAATVTATADIRKMQGEGDAATAVTSVKSACNSATAKTRLFTAGVFNNNGWEHFPVPEERVRINGANSQYFGLALSDNSYTSQFSISVVWQEWST